MEKVSLWCKIVALVSILSSIIMLILPESKVKKAFKTLLSFVMIYTFASPFANSEIDFSSLSKYLDTVSSDAVTESYEGYVNYPLIVAAESEIENYFNNLLASIGAEGECKAVCEIKSEKIILKEIVFTAVLDDTKKELIKKEVNSIYSGETIIHFSGE